MKKPTKNVNAATNNKNGDQQQAPHQYQQSFGEMLETYLKSREVFSIDEGKCSLIVDGFKYTAGFLRKRAMHIKQLELSGCLTQQQHQTQREETQTDGATTTSLTKNNLVVMNRNLGDVPPMLNLDDGDSRISTFSDDENGSMTITLHRSNPCSQNTNNTNNGKNGNGAMVENRISNNNNNNNHKQPQQKQQQQLLDTDNLVTSFFLSHFHSDHYDGLHENFKSGRIFCSPITAALLKQRWPNLAKAKFSGARNSSSAPLIQVLEVGKYYRVDLRMGKLVDRGHPPLRTRPLERHEVDVVCADANHCPGAVIFVFHSLIRGIVVHTGDFRFNGVSAPVEHEAFLAARNSWNTYDDSNSRNNNMLMMGNNVNANTHDDDDDDDGNDRHQNKDEKNSMIMMMMPASSTKDSKAAASATNKSASATEKKNNSVFSMMMNPNRNSQMFSSSANNKKGGSSTSSTSTARISSSLGPSVKRGNRSSMILMNPNNNNNNKSNTQTVSSSTQNNLNNGHNSSNRVAVLSLEEKIKCALPTKSFPLCDRPNKKVGDESALQAIKGNVSVLYLDNTFCDPKYAFLPQPQVLTDACVEVGTRIGDAVKEVLLQQIQKNHRAKQNDRNGDGDGLAVHRMMMTMMMDDEAVPHNNNRNGGDVENNNDDEEEEETSPIRIALCIGAYSIGKERVALAMHSAFGGIEGDTIDIKFIVPPNRAELLKCCEMPIKMKSSDEDSEDDDENNKVDELEDLFLFGHDGHPHQQRNQSSRKQKKEYRHHHVYQEVDPASNFYPKEESEKRVNEQKKLYEDFLSKYLNPNNNNNQNQQQDQMSLKWNSEQFSRVIDPATIEVELPSSSDSSFWNTISQEVLLSTPEMKKIVSKRKITICCFIVDLSCFSYPSVSLAITGNACFTTNNSNNNSRTSSPAIFAINDNFAIDLNDFDFVLSVQPTGWANAGPQSRDKRCKQVTMIGVPYSEHSSFTEMVDFVAFLQPERVIPTVSLPQYKTQEPEFLKKCKRLKIEHGSTPPLNRHFEAATSFSHSCRTNFDDDSNKQFQKLRTSDDDVDFLLTNVLAMDDGNNDDNHDDGDDSRQQSAKKPGKNTTGHRRVVELDDDDVLEVVGKTGNLLPKRRERTEDEKIINLVSSQDDDDDGI